MGSALRLTLAGACDIEADAAWTAVARVFERAERDLTRFDASSALSRLNQAAGSGVAVPRTLTCALATAWRAFRVSGGRFDPRIIAALEAAGEHAGVALPASPRRLLPDERWLRLDSRRGRAAISAPVDLGGIGKGLALRWAAAGLRRAGQQHFLIQAGGDLVASGIGPAARPWLVGLEDPTGEVPSLATIELRDAALATSSIAVRRWLDEDGGQSHHLIDPSTLEPAAPVWLSVTVLAYDPAWAEVASKVGFLAGRDVARATAPHGAWWVSADGRLRHSQSDEARAQRFTGSARTSSAMTSTWPIAPVAGGIAWSSTRSRRITRC